MLPKSIIHAYKNILKNSYNHICNIYIYKTKTPYNGKGNFTGLLIHENIPCRLSHVLVSTHNQSDTVNENHFENKIFLDNDVLIKKGYVCLINNIYYYCGTPSIFETHQEVSIAHEGYA